MLARYPLLRRLALVVFLAPALSACVKQEAAPQVRSAPQRNPEEVRRDVAQRVAQAHVALDARHFAVGKQWAESAVAVARENGLQGDIADLLAKCALAHAQIGLGELVQARATMDDAVAWAERNYRGREVHAHCLYVSSAVAQAQADLQRALHLALTALQVRAQSPDSRPLDVAISENQVGRLYLLVGQPAAAIPVLERSLRATPAGERNFDLQRAGIHEALAQAHQAVGDGGAVITNLHAAASHLVPYPDQAPKLASILERLAPPMLAAGKQLELEQLVLAAVESIGGYDMTRLSLIAPTLATVFTGRPEECARALSKWGVFQRILYVPTGQIVSEAIASRYLGSVAEVPAPAPRPSTPTVSNASQVVGEMREGFRACYNSQLGIDPNIRGNLRVTLHVTGDGHVTHVVAISYGLAEPCVDCILAHAGASRFSPPEGGAATIIVPITFVKQ